MQTPHLIKAPTQDEHIQGSLSAPIILVVYGDYQCQICKLTFPMIKQLQREFGDRLAFVFRHFPLKTSHPLAWEATKSAEAAALQGKFWEMHELIYNRQLELHPQIWVELAQELNLNQEKFMSDFQSSMIEKKLETEFMEGVRSGVNGVPCFYINGNRFDGDASYESLRQTLTRN